VLAAAWRAWIYRLDLQAYGPREGLFWCWISLLFFRRSLEGLGTVFLPIGINFEVIFNAFGKLVGYFFEVSGVSDF